jgi:hypothetical protein
MRESNITRLREMMYKINTAILVTTPFKRPNSTIGGMLSLQNVDACPVFTMLVTLQKEHENFRQ